MRISKIQVSKFQGLGESVREPHEGPRTRNGHPVRIVGHTTAHGEDGEPQAINRLSGNRGGNEEGDPPVEVAKAKRNFENLKLVHLSCLIQL